MMKPLHLTVAALLTLSTTQVTTADAGPIWVQDDFQQFSSAGASVFLPVNDFTLAGPAVIDRFTVWLSDSSLTGDGIADGVFTSFSGVLSWYFFDDDGGEPGTLLGSGAAANLAVTDTGVDRTDGPPNEDIFRVSGDIASGFALGSGTYWFGIREGLIGEAADGTDILWLSHNGVTGEYAKLFLNGAAIGGLSSAPNSDNAYTLEAVPEPTTLVSLGIGLAALGRRLRGRSAATRD
jgi:hypothetical protein